MNADRSQVVAAISKSSRSRQRRMLNTADGQQHRVTSISTASSRSVANGEREMLSSACADNRVAGDGAATWLAIAGTAIAGQRRSDRSAEGRWQFGEGSWTSSSRMRSVQRCTSERLHATSRSAAAARSWPRESERESARRAGSKIDSTAHSLRRVGGCNRIKRFSE